VRRLLRTLCPGRGGAKPAPPLRRRLPAFTACREGAGSLVARCRCPVYLLYAECRQAARSKPPVSYVLVGRVAIVSLDERIEGREREIGEELLRTVPGIEAVYAKKATVGSHRVQELVHIAGRRLRETVYVENGLRIPVPLGRVYVNPRLAAEHERIARAVEPGERVLDMFSGIGGFALNISRHGRAEVVVANDVNPHAVDALTRAIALNKSRLRTPILVLNEDASRLPRLLRPVFTRIIMNLPHASIDYIETALSLCSGEGCTLHVYTLARRAEDAASSILERHPSLRVTRVLRVLDYAPGKYIFRVDVQHHVENEAAAKTRG